MISGKEKYQFSAKARERIEKLRVGGTATEQELDQAQLTEVQSSVEYDQSRLIHAALVAMQAATNLMPGTPPLTRYRRVILTVVP